MKILQKVHFDDLYGIMVQCMTILDIIMIMYIFGKLDHTVLFAYFLQMQETREFTSLVLFKNIF